MIHPYQHIADLSEICYKHGVAYVVISPGSRNAPLIDAFSSCFGERCFSIVDERSAGYFGLGLARESKKPVVLVCTSGTAALNYGPALAEAYYQRIPLVAVTADRPAEWIDQLDNQTIRQKGIFKNYVKRSDSLPEKIADLSSLQRTHRIMAKSLLYAAGGSPGPVHINVPMDEPLYLDMPPASAALSLPEPSPEERPDIPEELIAQWNSARGICILHGQDVPDLKMSGHLGTLEGDHRVIIITENISNSLCPGSIRNPELMLAHTSAGKLSIPDLVIYSGGQLVSKRIKQLLRSFAIAHVWRIGEEDYGIDTFRQQNRILRLPAPVVYEELTRHVKHGSDSVFRSRWKQADKHARKCFADERGKLPFSDLSAVDCLLSELPADAILEMGNSSPVRYAQLIPAEITRVCYSNRGVSGIDGCLSAAAGTALSSGKLTLAILGDLSFVYDSNAMWNRKLPGNLRIAVLNNRGGGIFSLIDGPAGKAAFSDFFLAHHPVNLQKLAEAFNLNYFCARDVGELTGILPEFYGTKPVAAVLEILTDRADNLSAFNTITGRKAKVQDKKNYQDE